MPPREQIFTNEHRSQITIDSLFEQPLYIFKLSEVHSSLKSVWWSRKEGGMGGSEYRNTANKIEKTPHHRKQNRTNAASPQEILSTHRHGKWLYQRNFREWCCLLWFWKPWLATCMIKRSPLCHLLDWFFHGKFKGSNILHHGHVYLFDMNSGMAILYVQCHTTQEISWTLIEWLQIAVQSSAAPI